ncbi:MAG TPA: nitrate- and nitrite sensing domain-containing protein [Streptosporangiaceae bacterium]
MRLRPRSVRTRILLLTIVPILCLLGLYSFAATVTLGDAINLARSNTVKNATGEPTGLFLAQLEAERLLAVVYLADPTAANLASLQSQEAGTAAAAASLHQALTSGATMNDASTAEKRAIGALLAGAASLPALHAEIAARAITRRDAFAAYNRLVGDAYFVLGAVISQQNNAQVVAQALAFVHMGQSGDLLGQENALLYADLSSGRFTVSDLQQFTGLVGARRELYGQTLTELDPQYGSYYRRDVSPHALSSLVMLENAVVRYTRPGKLPPIQPQAWQQAVGGVSTGLSAAGNEAGNALTRQANNEARTIYLRLVLAGGVGMFAVLLSIFMSWWLGRRQVGELARLRESALELANTSLPDLVRRLAAGEKVDLPGPAPHKAARTREIRQVEEAFASVQQTAVASAVGQAQLRHGISDMFRNLARRSQSLLHRQLTLLDAMERRAKDPQELDDLFRVDHLATRMRRHAESLIILSGEAPARGWRHPVPMVDVLRAAVAEVEDYTRIKVTTASPASLTGPAVGDVIHIVAELAENATIYSPPQTSVTILGGMAGQGYTIEVEDRGLGLGAGHRDQLNALLADPPAFDLTGGDQLGLFVAAQLAKRHNVRVSLRPSPYGGTTAIVLIPHSLVIPGAVPPREPSALPAGSTARAIARPAIGTGYAGFLPDAGSQEEDLTGSAVGSLAGASPAIPAGSSLAGLAVSAADAAAEPPADEPDRAAGAAAEPGDGLGERPGESTAPQPAVAAAPGPAGDDALDSARLPRRIRQANLAPQLREGPARPATQPDLRLLTGRSPEESRQALSSIQRGWERGRSVFDPFPHGYRGSGDGTGQPADGNRTADGDSGATAEGAVAGGGPGPPDGPAIDIGGNVASPASPADGQDPAPDGTDHAPVATDPAADGSDPAADGSDTAAAGVAADGASSPADAGTSSGLSSHGDD